MRGGTLESVGRRVCLLAVRMPSSSLAAVLAALTMSAFAASVAGQSCVQGNARFVEWVEDYKAETDEMERICAADVAALRTSLIGKHGPPLDIEMKNAACYNSCQQYIRNVDFLLEISECSCAELDEVFPLSAIGHAFESWCMRRPTQFLMQETGVLMGWEAFDARFCKCSVAIACESSATRAASTSALAVALLLPLLTLFVVAPVSPL